MDDKGAGESAAPSMAGDRALPNLVRVLLLAALVQVVHLAYRAHTLWFVGDDWDPLLRRGTVPGASVSWLEPHYGNPSLLWVATYRAVFEVVGLRSYLPYALVTIAFHIATCGLLLLLLRTVSASGVVTFVVTWLLLFFGVGRDSLMLAASLGHTASMGLGLAAAVVVLRSKWSHRGVGLAALLLLLALAYSAEGVVSVTFVVLLALVAGQWRRAIVIGGIPAAAFVLWFLLTPRGEGAIFTPSGREGALQIPLHVWRSLTWPVGDAVGVRALGAPLVLVLLLVVIGRRARGSRLAHLALAGAGAAIGQGLLLALTRANYSEVMAGRYAYATVVLLGPAVALTLAELGERLQLSPRLAGPVLAVALLAYAIVGANSLQAYSAEMSDLTSRMPGRVLGMVAAVDAGERILHDTPPDFVNRDLAPSLVSSARIRNVLPDGAASAEDRLDVEVWHMTDVSPQGVGLSSPTAVVGLDSFAEEILSERGCRSYETTSATPALMFPTGQGAELQVDSGSRVVTVQLVRGDVKSGKREFRAEEGPLVIATTAKDAALFVAFNDPIGPYRICQR